MRLCKRKGCEVRFKPVVDWQKYCNDRCRNAVANARKAKLLRRAQRIIDRANALVG